MHLDKADVTVRSDDMPPMPDRLPATSSAICVLIGGAVVVWTHDLGPASMHMALHIGLMNAVAPLAAALLVFGPLARPSRPTTVWASAVVQLALLWSWHAPALQHLWASHAMATASHAILFVSALWFWSSLLRLAGQARWHGVAILLMTGKFACLLGVLLTFSPRLLHEAHHVQGTTLSDQQLAGLLMITACPLSYLVAGVVLSARLISGLRGGWTTARATAVR